MQRYKAIVEYDGTKYCGMQKQKDNHNTIQEIIEIAISKFANSNVKIDFSGRTDTGVHALGQVIHFDLNDERKEYSVLHGINFYLVKENIVIKQVEKVSNDFHARFSAKSRKYLYRVLLSKFQSPLLDNRVFIYKYDVDINKMIECSKMFVGKKMDFSSFCNAESVDKVNVMKTINKIDIIHKDNNEIQFYFEAKSFLHNMIRIMVGVLLSVGRGKISCTDVEKILLNKQRPSICDTAPACGLYFLKTEY